MDPVDDLTNYKFGIFYYNRADARTVVPKRNKLMGYTLNFAQPGIYGVLIILGMILIYAW